ncbi:hypothetical protein [Promicromonospora iranensis]|uniref:Uncharacterized protein n=1 Tax=Promicromonospora iranensis TaxID=1105144 RepID=A0ABU2CQJ0_9MICO|nr:hypothetical protein [Promicromonospora iranensis]MDR7383606.1 hypothetical protein [Promicromonospora iranensis]
MPVSEDGLASFASETVENTSADDVTISDIDAVTDGIDVVEWFLTREDWPDATVGTGPLPAPGTSEVATTIPAGHRALVAVTLRASDLEEALRTKVTVTYTDERATDSMELNWSVLLVPAGTSCGDY